MTNYLKAPISISVIKTSNSNWNILPLPYITRGHFARQR